MQLRFDPVQAADAALLARFLAGSDWPFHFERRLDGDWGGGGWSPVTCA